MGGFGSAGLPRRLLRDPEWPSEADTLGAIEGRLLLVSGLILLLGVAGAFAASRTRIPLLVAFLLLGMLLGSDGPGGIKFDDAELARTVGVLGLAAILFEGGLTAAWRGIRPVVLPAALLSTVGVAATAAVTAVAAYVLFDLKPASAFLLGAVVGSTDAAAVFATLRFTSLRRRLARVLEAESGINDPTAVALTIGLIEWVRRPDYGADDLALLLAQQLGIGLAVGVVLGFAGSWLFARLPIEIAPFAPVASLAAGAIAFGAADVLEGSGFLSVYIVGLWLGNTRSAFRRQIVSFHQGLAFLAQVVLFVVLGLLVFPSRLDSVVLSGLALAAVLILARPLAVWLSTLFQGFKLAERVLLGWAGLRGAVPIVLATFALSAGLEESDTIFNAVFFVVIVSALVQGPTLEPLARRLGLVTEAAPLHAAPIDVEGASNLDLLEFAVASTHGVAGRPVRELALPRASLVAVIVRGGEPVPPRGSTIVQPGDRMYILVRPERRRETERVLAGWREPRSGSTRPA